MYIFKLVVLDVTCNMFSFMCHVSPVTGNKKIIQTIIQLANISNTLFDHNSLVHREAGFPGGNRQTDRHHNLQTESPKKLMQWKWFLIVAILVICYSTRSLQSTQFRVHAKVTNRQTHPQKSQVIYQIGLGSSQVKVN